MQAVGGNVDIISNDTVRLDGRLVFGARSNLTEARHALQGYDGDDEDALKGALEVINGTVMVHGDTQFGGPVTFGASRTAELNFAGALVGEEVLRFEGEVVDGKQITFVVQVWIQSYGDSHSYSPPVVLCTKPF